MVRSLLTIAVILVIAFIFNRMYRSWQRRAQRTKDLPPLPRRPTADEATFAVVDATYLGTVTSRHWLDRVASHGLGGRGPCTATVTSSGIDIDRVGMSESVYLAGANIAEVILARGLAGRTFGRDSVVVVSWRLGAEILHTGIRIADEDTRLAFVEAATRIATLPQSAITTPRRSK